MEICILLSQNPVWTKEQKGKRLNSQNKKYETNKFQHITCI